MTDNRNLGKSSSPRLRSEFLKWEAFLLYRKLNRLHHDFSAVAEKLHRLEGQRNHPQTDRPSATRS